MIASMIVARLRAAVFFLDRWLTSCGEACCVGRSQLALEKALVRDRGTEG